MSVRQAVLEVIAVLAGAVIGVIVLDLLNWLFGSGVLFAVLGSPGRLLVILVTVTLFAVYYRSMPPTAAAIASFFTGVGLPALIAKLGFDSALTWGTVLFLYVVFAVVALFTYRFVHANAAVRGVAGNLSGAGGSGAGGSGAGDGAARNGKEGRRDDRHLR